jgi:hypothetical protein
VARALDCDVRAAGELRPFKFGNHGFADVKRLKR